MWNLFPMCGTCNQDYKKTIDVVNKKIEKKDHRVVAFYPFAKIAGVSLSVDCIIPIKDPKAREWVVSLAAIDPEELDKITNWDRVFSIKKRLSDEIHEYHDSWIMELLVERNICFKDATEFKEFFLNKANNEDYAISQRMKPSAHIRKSFFEYIHLRADRAFIGKYMYAHEKILKDTA